VTVRVTDNESPAQSDTQSFHILVKDVAPTARVLGPAIGFAGQGLIFTLRAGDASADAAAGFRYVVRWGDGTPAQIIAAAPGNGAGLLGSHVYSVHGFHNVRITATDKDGSASLVATTSVTIVTPPPGNVLPHLGAWTRNLGSTGVVQLSGSIEDRGIRGPFTLGVNWGDGKTSTFRVAGSGTSLTTFSRAHQYAAQGTYTIGLVVMDSRGGKDGRTILVSVEKDDGCEDNDTLAQACRVVAGAPVTGLILLDPDWYRFTTTGHGGISQYVFEVIITGGRGTVNLALFTPRGSFWKATSSGGGHRAAVSWATSAINVTYYFRVHGTPGLTYSVEVILPPT
jgi:PKD repeat protein